MKKRLIFIATILAIILALCGLVISASAESSDDPADSYEKIDAPCEDSDIDLWFDYSFRKTFTGDTVSTGKDTFSIYMAKNETESAQFVLYSEEDKKNLTAEITAFENGEGDSVASEIYYEMYITVSDADTTLLGWYDGTDTVIRNGEIPDPVAPLKNIGAFSLNGGKSQAFLIRAKTEEASKSGWYSATLSVKDSEGRCVKCATVYLYVWNFEIPEENHLQTAFFIDSNTSYGGSYKVFYDYLLENRLCGMDVPGGVSVDNEYLTDPRVSAIRITHVGGGGEHNSYMDSQVSSDYGTIYNALRYDEDFWEETKDKYYFYTADEPVSGPYWTGWTHDKAIAMGQGVEYFWPDAQLCVPYHEDSPYPDRYYTKALSSYTNYTRQDATQRYIDTRSCTVWCPMMYGFGTNAELKYYNDGRLRDLSGFCSGNYYPNGTSGDFAFGYFDWESTYGDFSDRIQSEIALKSAEGKEQYKMWAYGCGNNTSYTYANHLIENSGLQTKLLFWQLYQNDANGYLYYATNNWNETGYVDRTATGARTNCVWMPSRSPNGNGCYHYGNGVLFYGSSMGRVKGVSVIGSLRVELLRDSEEEYEMLLMLEELCGDVEVDRLLTKITKTVNNYISMPTWRGGTVASDMDEYDSVEYIRRAIGNEIEAATPAPCEHQWNEGKVTKAAKCLKTGITTYTCNLCGAQKTEIIPTIHSVGDCFKVVTTISGNCETDGRENLVCKVCGALSNRTVLAAHHDTSKYVYTSKDTKIHRITCADCGEDLNPENHQLLTVHKKATCLEAGYDRTYCRTCDYVVSDTTTEKTDHNYVNSVCTVCGEVEEGTLPGDASRDGKVNAQDILIITRILAGVEEADDATVTVCDISGDGKISGVDINLLVRMIAGL